MTVIKDNYLFPIYCDNAVPINGEKNFHATGSDIVDTVEFADIFVKKSGDEMTGDLIMEGSDVGIISNRIDTNNADPLTISLEGDTYLWLGSDYVVSYKPIETDVIGGRTAPEISCSTSRLTDVKDPELDQDAVTKKYLQDRILELQTEIIELEEEINALFPTVQRGFWMYNEFSAYPKLGEYTILDSGDNPDGDFEDAASIVVSNQDYGTDGNDGGTHDFTNVTPGQYLQILNSQSGNDGYGLYEVESVSALINGADSPYYVLGVKFVQDYPNGTSAEGLGRFKIYNPPISDTSMYLMRDGDTAYGDILLQDQNGDMAEYDDQTDPSTAVNKNYVDEFGAKDLAVHSTETLTAGNAADVVIVSQTNTEVKFKFKIPQGPQGNTGSTGSSGADGKVPYELDFRNGSFYIYKVN